MTTTARGMLLNFASVFKQVGFIPNGGRLYYLNRSQPPLFTQMVQEYFTATEDIQLVAELLPILDQEYLFWMENRVVQIQSPNYPGTHTLNLYNFTSTQPRPESYYEDYTGAKSMTEEQRIFYYSSLAAAAESGMDFSTKWFASGSLNLSSIETINIVPVDLNSILYANEKTLSKFHSMFGNTSMSSYYSSQAAKRAEAMMDIMWSKVDYQWYDYDLSTGSQRTQYFITNYMPLWAGLQNQQPIGYFTQFVMDEIVKGMFSISMDYVGGVPTSLVNSGQQWDFPYSWSPQQYFIIEALFSTNSSIGSDMALDLIERWVQTNYCGWSSTISIQGGMMFEKYNVNEVGLPGGGGEYVVQDGFGWTNGVALYLLNSYGSKLKYSACSSS
ncbi:Trehalase precursor [Heterostelium album PN500]|uniref:Trehalase n=1 Tax=Heterostelium pallidum (strain ATCC 26659 / Pp 5 / PN500) TaxID=670386 RepID=D3AZB1_HETP5|nr:Trehalase precursor [Heterostelium album PN500]EFA85494.1 Trehalase precursor [Heterostelium album PN500]|eukprot:XP_020437602.1 Trehalase precursor [Heterostelium album PN500]